LNRNGTQETGPGFYGHLNNLGQALYLSGNPGGPYQFAIWRNGVSTPVPLPPGVSADDTPKGGINDVGQFTVHDGVNFYVMTLSRGRFTQTVTLTNTGGSSIAGPISIALDNLPASASLYGISGATLCDPPKGSPFIYFAAGPLASQASVTGTLQFIDTAHTAAPYEVRVLAGPGERLPTG
jgi:hypothetical protein